MWTGTRWRPWPAIPAYGPNVPPGGAWYDEMLVSGNTVAVIGYSYARGGTELGLFNIDDKGGLSYRATYHLKSSDYYSSRNYASRLVGTRLVMYAPIPINVTHADPLARLPTLRQWQGSHSAGEFRPIAPPTRIYRTDEALKADDYGVTLHSVTTCDLAQPELRCESSGVLGKPGRVFYASEKAIYVWAMHGLANASALFRLPLDGSAPSALRTQGSPIDQFSFLEQPDGKAQCAGACRRRGRRHVARREAGRQPLAAACGRARLWRRAGERTGQRLPPPARSGRRLAAEPLRRQQAAVRHPARAGTGPGSRCGQPSRWWT